jgi:hypothetical protein
MLSIISTSSIKSNKTLKVKHIYLKGSSNKTVAGFIGTGEVGTTLRAGGSSWVYRAALPRAAPLARLVYSHGPFDTTISNTMQKNNAKRRSISPDRSGRVAVRGLGVGVVGWRSRRVALLAGGGAGGGRGGELERGRAQVLLLGSVPGNQHVLRLELQTNNTDGA